MRPVTRKIAAVLASCAMVMTMAGSFPQIERYAEIAGYAEDYTYGDLTYTIETDAEAGESYVTITEFNYEATEIVIPAEIEGIPVTSIDLDCFHSFQALERIEVEANNSSFSSIDGVLFNKAGTTLICYPNGRTDATYSVPDQTKTIDVHAFSYQPYLQEVKLPEGLSLIAIMAFVSCTALENVSFASASAATSCFIDSYAFDNTPFPQNLDQGDGLCISPDGLLWKVTSTDSKIVVPDSVTGVCSFAFANCPVTEIEFEGDCNLGICGLSGAYDLTTVTAAGNIIAPEGAFNGDTALTSVSAGGNMIIAGEGSNGYGNAFSGCDSLTSVTVEGDLTAYENAFIYCDSLDSVQIGGELETFGNPLTPNILTEFSYKRPLIEYNITDNPRQLTHTAEQTSVSCEGIYYNSWSDSTGYNNGFWNPDPLQEMMDSKGNFYAMAQTSGGVVLVPQSSGQSRLTFQKDGFSFGAAAIGSDDALYIFWGRDISDSVIADEMQTENLILEKYDLNGNLLDSTGLTVEQTKAQFPFDAGNANIVCNNGVVGILFNTEWTLSSDGLHHQGAEFAAFRETDLELLWFSDWEGSHSFGVSMIPTSYGFAAIQMGDAPHARGINMNTYYADENEVRTDYVCDNGHSVFYHSSGQYGTNGNHEDGNTTYTHMGGLAKSATTYAIAGKSERFYTSDVYYSSGLSTKFYDVFVKIVDQTLQPNAANGLAGSDRIDEATGEVADRNVIWLTSCNAAEAAGNVKIVTLESGAYCVLWEKFVDGAFDSIRYVILDECGNTLRRETAVYGARLSSTSVQPIVQGNTLHWAVADSSTSAISWYSVDIGSLPDPDEGISLGDVNGDDLIDAVDAAMILVEAANTGAGGSRTFTEKMQACADLNADGNPDAVDAALILQFAAGSGAGEGMTIEEFCAQFTAG